MLCCVAPVQAENVLLNEADEAAVADFGLAAELDVEETHRETQVKGTIGHIAPGLSPLSACTAYA